MKRYLGVILAAWLFVSNGCAGNDDNPTTEVGVQLTLLSDTPNPRLNRAGALLRFSINEEQLNPREIIVRYTPSDNEPVGALILTSGGIGNGFYGIGYETNSTINFAASRGLEIFEVSWAGDFGWGTDNAGFGYSLAMKGFTDLVKWLKENRIASPELIIASGGSGGAMQIAYGLTDHGLEELIDHAILTAGPPAANLVEGIFGEPDDFAYWPDGLGGFRNTDYIMGWEGNGDYCVNRNQSPPSFVLDALEEASVVNGSFDKDFDYPNTHLYFVNTDDLTNADSQARIYFEAVTSAKQWFYFEDETSHDVGGIEAGANLVRSILNEILR